MEQNSTVCQKDSGIALVLLNQSDAKLKLTVTWSPLFSRALGCRVFVVYSDILLGSDWLMVLPKYFFSILKERRETT